MNRHQRRRQGKISRDRHRQEMGRRTAARQSSTIEHCAECGREIADDGHDLVPGVPVGLTGLRRGPSIAEPGQTAFFFDPRRPVRPQIEEMQRLVEAERGLETGQE